jgi:hypothetical protein|tara:strand:+ start:6190 stop:6558 length:369 start_codon:yes stop_codon:yes gene_type:complete
MSKYCPECGKQGIAAGGKICSFCGHNDAGQSFATKPVAKKVVETYTPVALKPTRGDRYVKTEDEKLDGISVEYFDADALQGIDVDIGLVGQDDCLGSINDLNPSACNDFKKAVDDFQNRSND